MRALVEKAVDHINHNILDNRKSNLRLCTIQKNSFNRRKTGQTSKYKGIYFDKSHSKFKSQIKFNKKTYNLGRYYSEIEAARAYDAKAKELFKEFACLNFPSI